MALIVTQRSFVLLCVSEVVRFDGGELVSMAGEFNELRSVSFTFKGAVGGFGWIQDYSLPLCVPGDSRSVDDDGSHDQKH